MREADSSAALRNDKQKYKSQYGDSGYARMTSKKEMPSEND
jgi:hypothetical protein